MRNLLVILLSLISITLNATNYWVTPRGSDSNAGTDSSASGAWATWKKAITYNLVAGDTVWFKGGVYYQASADAYGYQMQNKGGTKANPICLFAWPADFAAGNYPILDCSQAIGGSYQAGVIIRYVDYIHIKGLTIRNVKQEGEGAARGLYIEGTNLTNHECAIVEQCTFYQNTSGIVNTRCDSVWILNCDAYQMCDSLDPVLPGDGGGGFNNIDWTNYDQYTYYKGCRAWQCSDDGFVAASVGVTVYDSCWSFLNGLASGGGNGFKLGWIELEGENAPRPNRVVKYCIAYYNRSQGFWTNEDISSEYCGSHHIYNNTAYHNGWHATRYPGASACGFVIENSLDDDTHELRRVFRNNLAFDNEDADWRDETGALCTSSNNSWNSGVTVSASDFIYLPDSATAVGLLTAARQSNGCLPDLGNFLKLGSGSDCIDAGEDTIDDGTINSELVIDGAFWGGSAPDLGAFEYTPTDPPVLPIIITTTNPFYLTESTARSGGYIVDDGGSAILKKGVCWNTTGTPTVRAADADSSTNDGNGSGSFSSTMWGLVIGTTYYVRAYAINSVDTAYGDQDAFTFIGQMKYVYVGGSPMVIQNKRAVVTTGEAESEGEPVPEYGDEMINEGDFTTSTKWGAHTGWTIADGVATYGDLVSGATIYQIGANMVANLEINTTYKITFDITIAGGGYARFYIDNSAEVIDYVMVDNYANGTNIVEFTTPADIGTGGISFWATTGSTASFSIDNISLKKKL